MLTKDEHEAIIKALAVKARQEPNYVRCSSFDQEFNYAFKRQDNAFGPLWSLVISYKFKLVFACKNWVSISKVISESWCIIKVSELSQLAESNKKEQPMSQRNVIRTKEEFMDLLDCIDAMEEPKLPAACTEQGNILYTVIRTNNNETKGYQGFIGNLENDQQEYIDTCGSIEQINNRVAHVGAESAEKFLEQNQ